MKESRVTRGISGKELLIILLLFLLSFTACRPEAENREAENCVDADGDGLPGFDATYCNRSRELTDCDDNLYLVWDVCLEATAVYPTERIENIKTGDIDGDGIAEIVLSHPKEVADYFTVLPGRGNGYYSSPITQAAVGWENLSSSAGVADFSEGEYRVTLRGAQGEFCEPENSYDFTNLCHTYDYFNIYVAHSDNESNTTAPALASKKINGTPELKAVGDFDGDGDTDLIIELFLDGDFRDTFPRVEIAVFLNNGDDFFQRGYDIEQLYGACSEPFSADFNLDGKLDLACANAEFSELELYLSSSDESFAAPFAIGAPLGAGYSSGSVALGDLDGDNYQDAVLAGAYGGVGAYLAAKDNEAPRLGNLAGGDSANTIASGDFNGDGYIDLATTHGNVLLYKNRGDGTFADAETILDSDYARSLTAGDLDGDDDLDLVAVVGGGIYTLRNNGEGVFTYYRYTRSSDWPTRLAAFDFDADGNLDLLFIDDDRLWMMKNKGDGKFAESNQLDVIFEEMQFIETGDLDGDGERDLVAAGYNWRDGLLDVWRNTGNGQSIQGLILGEHRDHPTTFTLGDIDLDGDDDLIVTHSGYFNKGRYERPPEVKVFNNDGGGVFAQVHEYRLNYAASDSELADLDGDGDLDLVLLPGPRIYINDGKGNFEFRVEYATGSGQDMEIVDLNGDGKLDLALSVVGHGGGYLNILLQYP